MLWQDASFFDITLKVVFNMRIANNIMALNTHRSYTINNDKVAASAEKLSSGYRINRAGDDAAGLAISEKMRSQIRGLNMATRNSQDAISLIQTAEGALQEVHSILQRMNELAVQSATGTNETFDRTQISKEFQQLKREINDISDQTTFNNMKLLDGSLSNSGVQRSKATVGIFDDIHETDGTVEMTQNVTPKVDEVTAATAKVSFKLEDGKITSGKAAVLKVKIGNGTELSITSDNAAADVTDAKDIAALFDGKGPENYTFPDGTAGTISVDVDAASGLVTLEITPANKNLGFAKEDVTMSVEAADSADSAGISDKSVTIFGGRTAVAPAAAYNEVEFSDGIGSLKVGDVFTLNNVKYELVPVGGTATDPDAIALEWNPNDVDFTDFAARLQTATQTDPADATSNVYKITANGDRGFKIEQSDIGVGDVNLYLSQATNKTTSVEFDMAKLKEGDKVKITVMNNKGETMDCEYMHNEQNTMKEIAAHFQATFQNSGFSNVELKGNTLIFDAGAATVDFTSVDIPIMGSMRIQVGALENEQLNIEVKAMNTAGLKLDGTDIDNQDTAGNAITSVRDAVNEVSDQRARLGAMQNRMTHKINNLKISAENLQAAESRIRDVDIAQEMTEFTKANILAQAATAMLAQANAAPQNVLSLLQ